VNKMKTNRKRLTIPDFMIVLKAIKDVKEMSVTELHHHTKITYAHLHYLKQLFLDKNWIILRPEGVKHMLSISNKGLEVVQGIEYLFQKMEISNEDIVEYRNKTKHAKKVEEIDEGIQQDGREEQESYE